MLKTVFSEIRYRYSKLRYTTFPPESSRNVDHERKIIFVHNPKCAGTTVKKMLGYQFVGGYHQVPTDLVPPAIWERYFSLVVIRNPFDRLVSAFSYHTSPDYKGRYFSKYPFLRDLSLEAYFDLMNPTNSLRPNIDFVRHGHSKKPIDFICRFENLEQDLRHAFSCLNITIDKIPHENESQHKPYQEYFKNEPTLLQKCSYFYKDDLDTFGYEF